MKYITVNAITTLPQLKFKLKDPVLDYWIATITIGKYSYIFSKQLYPPNHWIQGFWSPNLYKKIKDNKGQNNLSSNIDLQGIRLDVTYKGQEFGDNNDVGDQPHYKLVMDLIYKELSNIAKTGSNLWIVNDLNDSVRRESIYDRFGKKLCSKFGYVQYKFRANGSESYRFLTKESK